MSGVRIGTKSSHSGPKEVFRNLFLGYLRLNAVDELKSVFYSGSFPYIWRGVASVASIGRAPHS